MASDLNQVQGKVTLTGDTSGADQATSALQRFGSMLGNIGQIALGINLANIMDDAINKVKEIGEFSIQSASNIEQTRITMDAFTGSVQKGGEAMQILNNFARNAPLLPLQDIFQGGQQILGFGFGLDQLGDKLKTAGELAIAAHTPLSVAIDLLARAKEGIFNIREFGQFGISREELQQFGVEFKKAGAVVNGSELLPALERLANARFGNIFQEQAGTFAGSVQNVKDDFMRLAAMAAGEDENGNLIKGSIFDNLQTAANGLYSWLEGNMPNIENFFKQLNAVLVGIGNFLTAVFTPVWQHLEQVFEKHKTTITELGKALGEILLVGLVIVAEGTATLIDWGIDLVDNFLTQADAIMKVLSPAIDYLWNHWNEFLQFFVAMGTWIKQTSVDIANDIITMIDKIIDAINGLLSNSLFRAGVQILAPSVGGNLPNHINDIPLLTGGTPSYATAPALASGGGNTNGGLKGTPGNTINQYITFQNSNSSAAQQIINGLNYQLSTVK